jgi:putative SOS response-associated peptidase YedK
MCGRYALSTDADGIVSELKIRNISESVRSLQIKADWNIAPTKEIYIIKSFLKSNSAPSGALGGAENERILDIASWGMIAPWSKNYAEAVRSQSMAINARSESVHQKPTFRSAFRSQRCLIPATGYYEWATELGKYPVKQPVFISSRSERLLLFAGIYSYWFLPDGSRAIQSASIITRAAVADLAEVHNRMPLFLPENQFNRWLDPDTPSQEVENLIQVSSPDFDLQLWPVSSQVNSTRNNGVELIRPIELGESQTLF